MQSSASLLRVRLLHGSFIHSGEARFVTNRFIRHVSSSAPSRTTARVASSMPDAPRQTRAPPLARLPLSHVVRSYMIMSMSSSNILLSATMAIMERILRAKSALFDPDRNPVLNWILRRTFYDQFCAGSTKTEIGHTIESFQRMGYGGIVLEYAAEVLDDAKDNTAAKIERDIEAWKQGVVDTVHMVEPGDFIAFKWSGMGPEALRLLKHNEPPTAAMAEAMTTICDAAAAKGVRLLPAAEPQNANPAVDAWTIDLCRKYNQKPPNEALIFNTYQCYLKVTPKNLAKHLADAAEKGYTLGVKLVRGAYLETEQRDLIWDTKAETDKAYDEITASLLRKTYGEMLKPAKDGATVLPSVNIVLATHNEESVQNARAVIKGLDQKAQDAVKIEYAQLQGMADEVSCGLLAEIDDGEQNANSSWGKVYKYMTWGSTKQCLHYLVRRGAENREAFARTVHTRQAMGKELRRRFASLFGMG